MGIQKHNNGNRGADKTMSHITHQIEHAKTLVSRGSFKESEQVFTRLLISFPKDVTIIHEYALCEYSQGKIDKAIELVNNAINIAPNRYEFHSDKGVFLYSMGDKRGAYTSFCNAISLHERFAEGYYNKGTILYEIGNLKEAIEAWRTCVVLEPKHFGGNFNLGIVSYEQEKYSLACQYFRSALTVMPQHSAVNFQLAVTLDKMGSHEAAVLHVLQALVNEPLNDQYCLTFSLALSKHYRFLLENVDHKVLEDTVVTCYEKKNIDYNDLAELSMNLIIGNQSFKKALKKIRKSLTYALAPEFISLAQNPLFISYMRSCVITNRELEILITNTRKCYMAQYENFEHNRSTLIDASSFIHLISHQMYLNEYVYEVTREESILVDTVQNDIDGLHDGCRDDWKIKISLLAMYKPLFSLNDTCIKEIQRCKKNNYLFTELVKVQIEEPLLEKKLAQTIPSIKPISDETSQKVQQQYEENPYPRWKSMNVFPQFDFDVYTNKLFNIQKSVHRKKNVSEILVAGAGTGKHPLTIASQVINCNVTALDLSFSSLSYSKRMALQYGIDNVAFVQGDILDVALLNKKFDYIECCGVLHHMVNPQAGLEELVSVLKPGRLMKIGLYSKMARKNIIRAREKCNAEKLISSPREIRSCRQRIMQENCDHSFDQIQRMSDFYSLSELRDMLFHTQEYNFTLLEIAEMLDSLNLKFTGFCLSDDIIEKFSRMFPREKDLYNLEKWHLFELEHELTFIGMYQFGVQCDVIPLSKETHSARKKKSNCETEVLLSESSLLIRGKKYAKAIDVLRSIDRVSEKFLPLWCDLFVQCYTDNNSEQFYDQVYEMIYHDKRFIPVWKRLGDKLFGDEKYEKAITAYENALSEEDSCLLLQKLGDSYAHSGKYESAKLAYEVVLAKDPTNLEIQEALEHTCLLLEEAV